jgi:hypothetical protein
MYELRFYIGGQIYGDFLILSEVQTCLVSILKIGGDYMTFE